MNFQREISAAERVGIPAATFALGALVLYLTTYMQLWILPWVGALLIFASLGTYIWLTARSTQKVRSLPPPIPKELHEQLAWLRVMVERLAFDKEDEFTQQLAKMKPGSSQISATNNEHTEEQQETA